jgi:hypothetical protein
LSGLVAVPVGRPHELLAFLSGQLAVLKGQAQMLMGLAGLVVTVTGFSGHNMVRGGPLSTAAMIGGIAFVLLAIVVTLRVMTQLRWVSQDLRDDLTATASIVLRRRDRQQRSLLLGAAFIAVGLGAYLLAVVVAAVSIGAGMGPPP